MAELPPWKNVTPGVVFMWMCVGFVGAIFILVIISLVLTIFKTY